MPRRCRMTSHTVIGGEVRVTDTVPTGRQGRGPGDGQPSSRRHRSSRRPQRRRRGRRRAGNGVRLLEAGPGFGLSASVVAGIALARSSPCPTPSYQSSPRDVVTAPGRSPSASVRCSWLDPRITGVHPRAQLLPPGGHRRRPAPGLARRGRDPDDQRGQLGGSAVAAARRTRGSACLRDLARLPSLASAVGCHPHRGRSVQAGFRHGLEPVVPFHPGRHAQALAGLVLVESGDFATMRRMLRGVTQRAESVPGRVDDPTGQDVHRI
jgi:hypothetical protein